MSRSPNFGQGNANADFCIKSYFELAGLLANLEFPNDTEEHNEGAFFEFLKKLFTFKARSPLGEFIRPNR